jgi:hypothetical protein
VENAYRGGLSTIAGLRPTASEARLAAGDRSAAPPLRSGLAPEISDDGADDERVVTGAEEASVGLCLALGRLRAVTELRARYRGAEVL